MTHIKNAEAFARIVDFCTGYGGTYNPGRPTLRLDALMHQLQSTRQALDDVIIARSLYDNAVNERRNVFDQLPRLASSVMRTLEASEAAPEKVLDARMFVCQLTGKLPRRKRAVPAGETELIVSQTGLQLAYVSRADSFAKLVQAVATEPLYLTNEPMLSVAGLAKKVEELNHLNMKVSVARVNWSNARINRNTVMYRQSASVLKTVRAIKKYIRAIFGMNSEQFAQVKTLHIIKPGHV